MGISIRITGEPLPDDLRPVAEDFQRYVGELVQTIKKINDSEYEVYCVSMFCNMQATIKKTDNPYCPWQLKRAMLWLADGAFHPNDVIRLFKALARSADSRWPPVAGS